MKNKLLIFILIILIVIILFKYKIIENFSSTSNGTLLQLKSKDYQDNNLTNNHNYYDSNRGYRYRSYPRNNKSENIMNTHVIYPGGYFPLSKHNVNTKSINSW